MEYRLRSAGLRNMAVAMVALLMIALAALGLCWRLYADNRTLVRQLVNNRQTIVVPYGADTPFSFTGERGDARYLRLMALAWLNLRLNINNANADASHEMLMAAACDGAEKKLRSVLAEEASRVKGNSGGSAFYPKDVGVWTDKGIVEISGQLKLSYGRYDGASTDKHFRIRTDMRHNRLCWTAFLEVPHA